MRVFVYFFLAASLAAGLVGAAAAYLCPLAGPDAELAGLTLRAPAGAQSNPDGSAAPIGRPGAQLTPELISALRRASVRYVVVTTFSFHRSAGAGLFVGGSAGLLCSALLLGAGRRKARKSVGSGPQGEGNIPASILASIRRAVEDLRLELRGLETPSERLRRVLAVLTQVQDIEVPHFVSWRPVLNSRLGLSGYASLMDRFAAAERQLNRAWSAAADGIETETSACLDRALERLDEAAALLPRD